MSPAVMLLLRACRNEIGRTTLSVAEAASPTGQVLVFSDAVWLLPRMFKADDHHGRRRCVESQGFCGAGIAAMFSWALALRAGVE